MPHPYDKTTYSGKTVDWLTRAALEKAATDLGYADGLTLEQGSYNPGGVSASGGTHDGGGVVDLSPFEWQRKVRVLRKIGFAAWHRPAIPRLWGEHIHAVLMGNAKLSPAAKAQVAEYLAGFDGLAGSGRDTGPRQFVDNRFEWQIGAKRISAARSLIARAQAKLATGIRGHRVQPALRRLRAALDSLPKEK